MKKIIFAVMAVFAIGLTSCGNKAQAPAEAPAEEEEAVVYNAEDEAAATISALTEQIEAKDATKLQEVLTTVQDKIKEIIGSNPEVAKEYVTKVQTFLKDNADKIKAFAGENAALNAALGAITEAPAETVVNGLLQAVEGTKAAADGAVEAGKEAVEGAVEDAKKAAEDKANEVKDAAKEKAGEAVDAAADKAKKALGI